MYRSGLVNTLVTHAIVFSKNKNKFDPENVKKPASKVAHNRPRPSYFTVQPRPTAHSPELIFHIEKSRDQTSVLLSVGKTRYAFFFKFDAESREFVFFCFI